MTQPGESVAVRLGMEMAEAERLAELLPRLPAPVKLRTHDQLWLKAVLEAYLPRVAMADRDGFTARANRVLEALDLHDDDVA
jgi:hypothetical protein